MKLSVSLPADDVAYLDAYATAHGYASRSAVVQEAVRRLRTEHLEADYASAWGEWSDADAEAWDVALDDGISG